MRRKEGGPHHFLSLDARTQRNSMLLSPPDGAGRSRRAPPTNGRRVASGPTRRLATGTAPACSTAAVALPTDRERPARRLEDNEGADRDKMGPIAEALRGHRERWEAIRPYLICSLLYGPSPSGRRAVSKLTRGQRTAEIPVWK